MTLPATIGRFRVLDLLGKGAMGVVYRGLDEALDRQVALKVMAAQGMDGDARARFKREAQAAARLQHPNIVTIYELGEHQGQPFMALELLEGTDLQRAIEGGLRPDPKVTLPVVLQLLAGLGHAHEHGIVHRDVKPSNLFLPRGRPAKIMDFGVARLAGGLTTAGMVIGTPNYMSPEQVRASGGLDHRSDLFSTGLILYELVTGEKAYRADSIVALMYKIAHEQPDLSIIPRGREWETLRGVIERALQHDLDERYPDARTMASDIARALRELGGTSDWTTASDAGLLTRTARAKAVELGTMPAARPQPPVELGTGADEAPPPTVFLGTRRAEPAPEPAEPPAPVAGERSGRSPFLLAGILASAAIAILAFAVWNNLRQPAAPAPSAATTLGSPVAAPSAEPATPSPPTRPAASATTLVTPAPGRSQAPATPRPPVYEMAPALPPPQNARLDRAEALLAAGRYATALAEARELLRRDPRNADAQQIAEEAEASLLIETSLKKARQALARGDKETAIEEIKKGLSVNSNEARLLALWREATQ